MPTAAKRHKYNALYVDGSFSVIIGLNITKADYNKLVKAMQERSGIAVLSKGVFRVDNIGYIAEVETDSSPPQLNSGLPAMTDEEKLWYQEIVKQARGAH